MTSDATQPDPATLSARCPVCRDELWRQRAGQWSLVAAIVKLRDDGRFVAKCSRDRCRGEVDLPWLALQTPPAPSPKPTSPRLVVRRRLVQSP